MGGIIKRHCPYCRTTDVAFSAVYEWPAHSGEKRALFRCGSCHEGVIWHYLFPNSVLQYGGNLDKANIIFGKCWPETPSGSAPDDTPAVVANFFEQGTSSLSFGNFDAAGMMFRKALETATKLLDSELSKKPLVKRIDHLAGIGKLTSELAEWAHEVRVGGNDAAHDDDPFTREDADDLRNFIEYFLRYAFTLPSAVKRRSKPVTEAA